MRHIRRSALVGVSPQRMFDLINDVERYPEFVPGCSSGRSPAQVPMTSSRVSGRESTWLACSMT